MPVSHGNESDKSGRRIDCSAQATTQAPDLEALKTTLSEDTQHMFDERGIDTSVYAKNVMFRDPITKYDDVKGFVRNLAFLKNVFLPTYEILDYRDVNETDMLARWTMGFDVLPIQRSPLGRFWWPRLEFTGTTLYGTNAKTGLIERHIDTWDSIEKQEYPSIEGFLHMLGQIFTLRAPPKYTGPPFTLLKRKSRYSLRKYGVLEYVYVRDDRETSRSALSPLLFSQVGRTARQQMCIDPGWGFVIPESSSTGKKNELIGQMLSMHQANGIFATVTMTGDLTRDSVAAHSEALAEHLKADGLQISRSDGGTRLLLLQHNDPGKAFGQTDLLMHIVDGFDLWQS